MCRRVDLNRRKMQCEECLVLDARELLRNGETRLDAEVALSWAGDGWIQGSTACMERRTTNKSSYVVLRYGFQLHTFRTINPNNGVKLENTIRYQIQLDSTSQKLGEKRHWFICPVVKNGRACRRRVRVLYLPQGAQYFGCRHCHNLVYRSSREQRTKMESLRRSLKLPAEEWLSYFCRTHDLGKQKEHQLLKRFHELRGTSTQSILSSWMKD